MQSLLQIYYKQDQSFFNMLCFTGRIFRPLLGTNLSIPGSTLAHLLLFFLSFGENMVIEPNRLAKCGYNYCDYSS